MHKFYPPPGSRFIKGLKLMSAALVFIGGLFASQQAVSLPVAIEGAKANSEISADDDRAMVLQKCLDLKELQAFYPKNERGSFKQLHVLQHGVSFPETIGVSYAGQKVQFVNKQQLKSENVNAYFYFHEFRIEGNTARIEYAYNYDQATDSPKIQVISLELQKTERGWNVTKSKLEAR